MEFRAYLIAIFVFAFAPFSSFAAPREFNQSWEALGGAAKYDFEISLSPKFLPTKLVEQGRQKETRVTKELNPGLYYFRIRGVDSDGKVGPWSTAQSVMVLDEPIEILK